jgi:hypothetical protein
MKERHSPPPDWEAYLLAELGPAAIAASDELVAIAPPLTPRQRDEIAVLLGRCPPA